MKFRSCLTVLFFFVTTLAAAQEYYVPEAVRTLSSQTERPGHYLSVNTGMNGPTGMVGLRYEQPVSKLMSVQSGVGHGLWGWAANAGVLVYPEVAMNWRFGLGLTYHFTGRTHHWNLEDAAGQSQTVAVDCHPGATFNVTATRLWPVGRRHRLGLTVGYASRLRDNLYQLSEPIALSTQSTYLMRHVQPGGPMATLCFQFGW